jgi:putative redox protein
VSLIATARSAGDTLRQEVPFDGHHRLFTDEPAHLGGTDAGPAPHELLPAALAACIAVRAAST